MGTCFLKGCVNFVSHRFAVSDLQVTVSQTMIMEKHLCVHRYLVVLVFYYHQMATNAMRLLSRLLFSRLKIRNKKEIFHGAEWHIQNFNIHVDDVKRIPDPLYRLRCLLLRHSGVVNWQSTHASM